VGSGGVVRGERSGDRPAVGGEKFFFAFVWAGGKNEENDVDEGRSGDRLKIGEISKKRSSKKFYIDVWCPSVSVGEIFSSAPPETPSRPPPGLQL
jgi:hypothetical protein